jgi:hypothetical protein
MVIVIRELIIETPDGNIQYEGVDTLYFNRKTNASRITVGLDVDNNYILRLKPNSNYRIKSYSSNGDQGPFTLSVKTDGEGKITHDDQNRCM